MSNGKKILITGASGMVGSLILERCLESQQVATVSSLVRKSCGRNHHKLHEIVVPDFTKLDACRDAFSDVDTVFYCLGVYTGAVSRDQFRQITVEFPEILARSVQEQSPNVRFCLLSGAGADRSERSRLMFARDKGMIENRLSAMGLGAFHSFRPAYIYPVNPRKEPNFSYKISRWLYTIL